MDGCADRHTPANADLYLYAVTPHRHRYTHTYGHSRCCAADRHPDQVSADRHPPAQAAHRYAHAQGQLPIRHHYAAHAPN